MSFPPPPENFNSEFVAISAGMLLTGIQSQRRADYGEQIISTLSQLLTSQYGKGFSKPQLWNCLYIVEIIPGFLRFSTHSVDVFNQGKHIFYKYYKFKTLDVILVEENNPIIVITVKVYYH